MKTIMQDKLISKHNSNNVKGKTQISLSPKIY